ncbi:MAG: LLM class flavin-dependent oxidoreductase [Dehalococcoidia bacterium]|jgi:alkanesulfonate monooxygenase SsuD/methylene tetrahydromethanopterin reductase-like flavin-dependent oxidoreductase (luciferase family)|nr:LLM class flavin-dependent oxidoreductase [Dehalococcoidia bacterium]
MIKRFSVLYVGQIDLENTGLDGTPADERRYPNERLVGAYDNAVALAKHMDELDYYCLWTAEHHFQREGYECFPNLILLGVHLAGLTKRLKFGGAFNVVPMWHPLRLAEDFAMADIMTGGRLIFGVGRGYHSREVETFGAPVIDNEANKELFEEQMEIIFKAFNEDSFSHKGKHYTIPADVPYRGYQLKDITLVPKPINNPVEIWQPIASGRTLEYIARKGIKGMVALTGELLVNQLFSSYRDIAAEEGRELALGQDMALGIGYYIAGSQQEAINTVRPYHDERYKWFAPFGFVRYTDSQGRAWGTPGAPSRAPTIEEGVEQKVWYCGEPDGFIQFLRDIEERYPGLEDVVLQWPEGMPWLEYKEQLSRFAKDVMPAFTGRG